MGLSNEVGEWITDKEELKAVAVKYLKDLFDRSDAGF